MEQSHPAAKSAENFQPPRHWTDPEELNPAYWADPKIQEKRSQEFFEKPVEWLEQMDKSAAGEVARRDFLTVMGASMAMAGAACARRPVHKIIPYVVKPEEITPGVANWYASTCTACGGACGVLVKTREGRPIKVEGNPEHPISNGATCLRCQASVLSLYDPDRLRAPVTRSRDGGPSREISWADADSAIAPKLKSARNVRLLTGPVRSPSQRKLIGEWLATFPNGKHVECDPLALEELWESQELSYGAAVVPHYRFDRANVVVSLGADFLGGWLSPVEYARDWASLRKLHGTNPASAKLSKVYCFEPTVTITGASADERFAVRPGDERRLALALAHALIIGRKRSPLAGDADIADALKGYSPEDVGAATGVSPAKLRQIADELWEARGSSLVVAGSVQAKTPGALGLQVAVNLLNSALGNDGSTIDGVASVSAPGGSYSAVAKLIAEMKAGQVDALVVHGTNPNFTLPRVFLGFDEAVSKVPLVVAISDREDETARLADYVLPSLHDLESWGDFSPRKGIYSLQQPTIAPLYDSRAFEDTLLAWLKAGGKARAADYHEYLMANWRETLFRESGASGSFELFWEGALRDGVLLLGPKASGGARAFRPTSLAKLGGHDLDAAGGDVVLSLYSMPKLGDGRMANNPWVQEAPDPISSITWDNFLNVSPQYAKKLDLHNDDVVDVTAGGVTVQLPVNVQPGMHPGVVSVAVGYGRRAAGKVGDGAGVDVYPFVNVVGDRLVFAGQPVFVSKSMKFYKLARTQNHTLTENRPVINDVVLAQYRANPAAAMETNPELRLETVPSIWPKHEYKGYRWGMAIDLNSCTGCGTCVVACQAENNIPVVGRDQVRVSRQMQWIRIDRYYSGSADAPQVIFEPMLCQHCENASCETVCPVLATVHDDEGVNVQVYNRCVGTRYCQNNCPYKVRRFNFFDSWKSYTGNMNLAWNPDVTVRTRGIMEKCSFCLQRVREAKDTAKDRGERVADGVIKPACVQTCPTEALVFGDMNDPETRVSKLQRDQRAFRVLENLNNKPSISYLTKVRNVEAGGEERKA
jgi:molybdopterin-containing oxidoreductase family iron-sulfur binding subunit